MPVVGIVVSLIYSCRLSLIVVTVIRDVPRVGTAPPWVPSGGPIPDHQEGGGSFSKRGERQTETNPVPIFMREVEKNVVFQRKQR